MTAIVGSQCVGLEENGPVMKAGQPQNYIPPQSHVQSSCHRMPCLAGSSPQGCSCRKNPRPVCSASYHLVERSRKHRSHKLKMGQHYNLDWFEHLERGWEKWGLTESRNTQQMLCSLSNWGRQSQVHKGLHPKFVDKAQPEVVLLLDWVWRQGV